MTDIIYLYALASFVMIPSNAKQPDGKMRWDCADCISSSCRHKSIKWIINTVVLIKYNIIIIIIYHRGGVCIIMIWLILRYCIEFVVTTYYGSIVARIAYDVLSVVVFHPFLFLLCYTVSLFIIFFFLLPHLFFFCSILILHYFNNNLFLVVN